RRRGTETRARRLTKRSRRRTRRTKGVDQMKTVHLVLVAAVSLIATSGFAQAPAPPDYSKMEVQTTQLAPNFYRFEAVGPVLVGNAGILTGPDGIFMVDAQTPQMTEKLVAAIKKVSDGKIRFIVNTHHHPDHTGGDANFAAMGVALLSRD